MRLWSFVSTIKILGTVFLLSIGLMACGGGEGGSGSTAVVPLSYSYFPVGQDIEYYYNNSSQKVSFTDKVVKGGMALLPLLHPTNAKEYFSSTINGLSYCGFYTPNVYVSGAGYFSIDVSLDKCETLLSASATPGATVQYNGSGNVFISPTYGSRRFTYTGSSTYIGNQTINTPYGSFDTKYISYNILVTSNVNGLTVQLYFSTQLWLAENIGIVRRIESGQTFNLTNFIALDTDNDGLFDAVDPFPFDPAEQLSINTTSLNVSSYEGSSANSNSIQLTSTGPTSINWTAEIEYLSSQQNWLNLSKLSGQVSSSDTLDLIYNQLPAGTHSARIAITYDKGVSTKYINVTYQVNTVLQSPGSISLNVNESTSHAELSNNIPITNFLYNQNISSTYTVTSQEDWLVISNNTGDFSALNQLSVSLDENQIKTMPNGSYSTQVVVSTNNANITPLVFSYVLNLDVAPSVSTSASSVSIDIRLDTTIDQLTRNLTVSSNLGEVFNKNILWTASSNASWLHIANTAGDTDTDTTLSLSTSTADIEALENGIYNATITLTPDEPGIDGASINVTLDINIPRIKHVAPFYASTNTQQRIILRGSGFNAISNQGVLFDALSTMDYNIVSDSEIRVTHPNFATPSTVQLDIQNGLNLDLTDAKLEVVEQPSMTLKIEPIPGPMLSSYYHPVRKALIMANAASQIVILDLQEDGSWLRSTYNVSGLRDIAISTDGSEVLAINDNFVMHYNAYTMAFIKQSDIRTNLRSGYFSSGFYLMKSIEMSNNGKMIIGSSLYGSGTTPIYSYDPETGFFNSIGSIYGVRMRGSEDGSFIIIAGNGTSPPQSVKYYRASTDTVYTTANSVTSSTTATNRIGNRASVEGTTLYDGDIANWGNIPYSSAIGFSPDGSETYGFNYSDNTLHVYDSSTYLGPGATFSEITSFNLGSANQRYVSRIISRDDGNVLFIIGNNDVVILPR